MHLDKKNLTLFCVIHVVVLPLIIRITFITMLFVYNCFISGCNSQCNTVSSQAPVLVFSPHCGQCDRKTDYPVYEERRRTRTTVRIQKVLLPLFCLSYVRSVVQKLGR